MQRETATLIAQDRGRLFEADFVLLEVNCGLNGIVIKHHEQLFHDATILMPNEKRLSAVRQNEMKRGR